jgi:protein TonB
MDRTADGVGETAMTMNPAVLPREMPLAMSAALMLSLAAHIGAMLWFGPASIRPPRPAAFETVEVSLVSEPAPRISLKPAMRPRVSRNTVATPAPETQTQESADVGPTPTAPAQGKDEPLVESRYDVSSLNNPKPPYPFAARQRGQAGRVILRAYVRADGTTSEVGIKQSSGYEALDNAALRTVQRWHFLPARRGTVAVDAWVEIPITFRLEG